MERVTVGARNPIIAITVMTDSDVDMEANPSSLFISTSDSSTLGLRDDELDPLTRQMQWYSARKDWLRKIKDDTDVSWCELLESVLLTLTAKLASSTLKSKVIGPLTYQEAEDIVSGFSGQQLNKWKEATQKGVEKDDWIDLIKILVRPFQTVHTSLFVLKKCNSKAQKSKTAECSPRRPGGTSCVSFFSIASSYDTHISLTAYHGVENGTFVHKSVVVLVIKFVL